MIQKFCDVPLEDATDEQFNAAWRQCCDAVKDAASRKLTDLTIHLRWGMLVVAALNASLILIHAVEYLTDTDKEDLAEFRRLCTEAITNRTDLKELRSKGRTIRRRFARTSQHSTWMATVTASTGSLGLGLGALGFVALGPAALPVASTMLGLGAIGETLLCFAYVWYTQELLCPVCATPFKLSLIVVCLCMPPQGARTFECARRVTSQICKRKSVSCSMSSTSSTAAGTFKAWLIMSRFNGVTSES